MRTTSDITLTTRYIHNWVSFLLSPNCFILSGVISNCPLLFPSTILDTFQLGGLISWCHIFLPFHTVHVVFQARIMAWVAISFSRRSSWLRDWTRVSLIVGIVQFSAVQSLSRVWLFATPWIAARQASLSITNSGVQSNSRLSSQWCHPAISSSVIPFSCPQSRQHQRLFHWVNSS